MTSHFASSHSTSQMAFGHSSRRRDKSAIANAYIERLRERGDVDVDAPGFVESIKQHFERLPTRYAMDVNIDSLDPLSHRRLLEEARLDPSTVSFAVRPVEILVPKADTGLPCSPVEVRVGQGGSTLQRALLPLSACPCEMTCGTVHASGDMQAPALCAPGGFCRCHEVAILPRPSGLVLAFHDRRLAPRQTCRSVARAALNFRRIH